MVKTHFLALVLWLLSVPTSVSAQQVSAIIRGITVVAPPSPIGAQEMKDVQSVNADWIALVPYGFSRVGSPDVRYNLDRQWWGEREEGIVASIHLAREAGLKVMLKPQVYLHGSWVGDVDFDTEEEWLQWETAYERFITFYASIAIAHNVDMFCIGTEYKIAAQKRPQFWRRIISDLRQKYSNTIIYSSNWDGYEAVPFWDALDYVGISSYFPLSEHTTPPVNMLKSSWRSINKRLRKFHAKTGKKIIFTEYGYMSVDGCAGKAWEIEKDRNNRAINEKAQANAYHALMAANWGEDYWAGGFLWKWFPAGMGHEGYPEKDYTPQGKLSQKTITDWYGKQ